MVSTRKTRASFRTSSLTNPLIVLLSLSLLTSLIYSNTFSASFQFDDINNIVENPQIKKFSSILLSGNRFVGYLSFALNYFFGGLNVFGYHLVNLLIHISNGFLVYALIIILFKTPKMQSSFFDQYRSRWIATAAALLFVSHPVQTQAVTYIVQRFASLAALFYLLAVVFYLKWRLAPTETKGRFLWYAGAWLSTVLAMKTKEISFTLPFMLILVEAVFFESLTRKQWFAMIPFLLTLLIIPSSRQISRTGGIAEWEGFALQTTSISRLDYFLTELRVIMTYLRLLIFPVHQNLDYDYPISHSLLEPNVLFSFIFLLSLFVLSLYLLFVRSRTPDSSRLGTASRLVAFGILWFFLTISIESSIIPIFHVIFEHRLYLPSVGMFLAGSVLISVLLDRWRGMSTLVIGVLVIIFSVATYQRNFIWKDGLSLWKDVVQKSPNKASVHYNLGAVYQGSNRLEEAIEEYLTALKLQPNYADAHVALGTVYGKQGRVDEENQEYLTALRLDPNNAEAHYHLGDAYQRQGFLEEAIQEYKTALTLNLNSFSVHYNMAMALQNLGRLAEAVEEYKAAIALDPDRTEAHNNLGNAYNGMNRAENAIQEYMIALRLDPKNADALSNLGSTYQKLGRLDEAVQQYKKALTLKPNNTQAHYNLGLAYQKLGRRQDAIQEFEQALQLESDFEPARQGLLFLRP
jgi:tetratricopeptide (TPR) repeat protein